MLQRPDEHDGRSTAALPPPLRPAPASYMQPQPSTAADLQAASGPDSGVLWVRDDHREDGPEPSGTAIAAEESSATPASQNGGTANGSVLWVRQDPWESARQPVAPLQSQSGAAPPQNNPRRGVPLSSSSNGNGAGSERQQHQTGSRTRLRVMSPAHHTSSGYGHRAAVFDNVE